MKKIILSSLLALGVFAAANAQIYKDDFTNNPGAGTNFWGNSSTVGDLAASWVSSTQTEYKLTRGGASSGTYQSISLQPYDNPQMGGTGAQITTLNVSGANDTIFVAAKASVAGTKLRIDLKDAAGYVSNTNVTNEVTLTTSYALYKFYYQTPQDGGYGGTTCTAGTGPCAVDGTDVVEFEWYVDGSTAGSSAVVTLNYLQIGGNQTTVPAAALTNPPTTGIEDATASVAVNNVYPNPTTDLSVVDLQLKSVSDVKVTLSDLYGKEISTVFNGTTDHVNTTVNTSTLQKGTYAVNYIINGSPAKSTKLVVIR